MAELLPLVLSVKAKNWRMYDDGREEADQEFQLVRKKVLQRDDYTCRFCGFKALSWMEVHHLNDDHTDNRLDNLITACQFCHMCQHIGLAGTNEEAVLIWCPEIPQATLHHIIRSCLVAERSAETIGTQGRAARQADTQKIAKEFADGARAIRGKLRSRTAAAERYIGTSDPSELANVMLLVPDEVYDRRAEHLYGIRLLPLGVRKQGNDNKMPDIIDTWTEVGGIYAPMRPSSWSGMLASVLSSIRR
jgi:intracellular multiplication protein IcmJ